MQRRHLKKGDIIIDCLLAWCCPHCVIMQNANEVGEAATYSHWTLKDLLKPPTAQDINKGALAACAVHVLRAAFPLKRVPFCSRRDQGHRQRRHLRPVSASRDATRALRELVGEVAA